MAKWLIAIIHPKKLPLVKHDLAGLGCEYWYPEKPRAIKIGDIGIGANELKNYILIILGQCCNEYHVRDDVRGVIGLAKDADGNHGYATQAEVEAMKDYQAKPPEKPVQRFKLKDRVKVSEGPLKGFTGAVSKLKRQNVVRVDMDAGKAINLPADLLEVIE